MVTATQTLVLIDHDDRRTLPVPASFRAHIEASRAPRRERGPRRSSSSG